MRVVSAIIKIALGLAGLAAALVVAFVLAAVWRANSSPEAQAQGAFQRETGLAIASCQILVKERLREPDSVEWVGSPLQDWPIYRVSDDERARFVRMTYRARNGFGGMNVETFDCPVNPLPDTAGASPLPRP